MALTLSDFDQSGLDVVALGLVTAGARAGDGTNYRSVDNGGPLGSLDVGSDFEVQSGQSITRIATMVSGVSGVIRIWDNPSGESWADYFTANPDVTLRLQVAEAGPAYELAIGNQGGNFSNWSGADVAANAAIDGIAEGDLYIIALAQTGSPPNDPPVADAGANQSVAAGAEVTLDGSGSTDPDGTIDTYAWTQTAGDTVALSDAAASQSTFTAPATAQTLTFRLTVTDNDGATNTDDVDIVVSASANISPTADAGSDQSVAAGVEVTLDGSGSSDPDGTVDTYAWVQTAGDGVMLSDPAAIQPTFDAPSTSAAQTLTFRLTVTDNDGATDMDDVDVDVAAAVAPVVTTSLFVVDWDNNGNFTDALDDITADVLRFSYRRGRDFDNIGGRATVGTAEIVVQNFIGKYSRSNSASPLAGYIFDGAPIEIRDEVSSVVKSRFFGYIRNVKQSTSEHTATIYIDGGISRLVGKRVKPPVNIAGALSGALMSSILDSAGWPSARRNIAAGQTMSGPYGPEETLAFDAIGDIEQLEGGFTFEDGAGNFVFQDRAFRLTGASLTSQEIFSDANNAVSTYLRSTLPEEPVRDVYNEVTVTTRRPTTAALAVLWTFDDTFPEITAGGEIIIIAAIGGSGIVDWMTTEIGVDLTATVPNSDLQVSVVKSAREMQITITNNASTVTTLTKLQARGQLLTFTESKFPVRDQTSIDRYGPKTYPLEVPYLVNLLAAQDRANAIITRFADPNPIIPVDFEVYDDALKNRLQALEVSSRVTFVAEGVVTNLGINTDFFVEAISESRDYQTGLHYITLELSSAAAFSGFFIWGISRWGIDTKWGF